MNLRPHFVRRGLDRDYDGVMGIAPVVKFASECSKVPVGDMQPVETACI